MQISNKEKSTTEKTEQSVLFVGVDLALRANHVVIVDALGKTISSFPIANDLVGATILRDKLLSLVEESDVTTVSIGMEATSIYWWHLHQYFQQEKILNSVCTVKVYTINPRLIKNFKKSYSKLDKTDPIDAYVIAERVRFGNLTESTMIDAVYEPLKRLTRFRFHLVENLVSEKNYLLIYLFLKYSSFQKVKPFRDAFTKTASTLIAELDMDEIARMPIRELVDKVITLSKGKIADAQKTAELLRQIANQSYTVDPSLKEPIDLILTNTYENIKYFQGKINSLDKVIEKEFKRYPNTLTSIPGIALVFAAGITGEMGETKRYPSEKHLASYAGLAWTRHQSGEFEASVTHAKQGNHYLRYYLVQAANSLRIHNESYKSYYLKKYDEGKTHKHKRALVLTARKLTRLIFAMLRDKRVYAPEEKEEREDKKEKETKT